MKGLISQDAYAAPYGEAPSFWPCGTFEFSRMAVAVVAALSLDGGHLGTEGD